MNPKIKQVAILTEQFIIVALIGAVVGAYFMHAYDEKQTAKTAAAVQAAQVATAPSK